MATTTGVISSIRGEIRQSTGWSIALGVLMIVSGVLAIMVPPIAGLAATAMVGWLLIVTGALHLGFAWQGEGVATVIGETLIAFVYAAIGVYVLARPLEGLASLTLAIAAGLGAMGMLEGIVAFNLRRLPGSGWLLFDGLLTIVLSVLIASAWPVSAVWAVGLLVGIAMVSGGVTRLMLATAVRRVIA